MGFTPLKKVKVHQNLWKMPFGEKIPLSFSLSVKKADGPVCIHPKIQIKFMRKTGIWHKTFANKVPFPFNESKRTKSSLPGKLWH